MLGLGGRAVASYPAIQHLENLASDFFATCSTTQPSPLTLNPTMASVYKSVSKTSSKESKDDDGTKKNKQRVLVLTSRGVTYRFVYPSCFGLVFYYFRDQVLTIGARHRHLLKDVVAMLPHSRKDAKLDTKSKLYHLNEIADLYNCNNVLFFEARKRQDLYMWMSKAPNGPCIKLHVQNCT